jgi:uncharacterized protein DUF4328
MQPLSDSPKMFASVKTLALWTTILLAANVLLDVIQVGFESLQLFLISSQPETAASALSDSDADISEMPGAGLQLAVLLHAGVAAIFNLLVLIATIVVFLIWEHRANSNLRPLGVPRPEFSSRWAVGSWFVPFLNLVVPFQIVRYIWRKSDPDTVKADGVSGPWNYSGADEFTLKAWWGFWIATGIVGRFSERISLRAKELSEYTFASWAGIIASTLAIIAALLAISVVRSVTARQEERYKRLLAASQPQFWSQPYSASGAPPNVT